MTTIYSTIPLCIDLDGTFIKEDVTFLSLNLFLKDKKHSNYYKYYKLFLWFIQGGKSFVKFQLSKSYSIEKNTICLNPEFYQFLYQQKNQGRILVLSTGATQRYAEEITQMYPFFTEVIASSPHFNCIGRNKATVLVQKYGLKGFDYAGNSKQDLEVWKVCRYPIAVNCPLALIKKFVESLRGPYSSLISPLQKREEIVDQLFVIAKNFLKEFSDFLEKTFDSYDIDYQEKILTINCPEERCFILHWHSPSQQLWLSSPLSGAWTFSYNSETEQWISSKHSKNLVELLKTELNSLVSS